MSTHQKGAKAMLMAIIAMAVVEEYRLHGQL
jgi:hypothetical protein